MSLAEFAGPSRLETAARAALVSSILQSNLAARRLILGAGLAMFQNELRPIVVIAQENAGVSSGMQALSQVDDAWGFIESALGTEPDWLRFMGAFVIPSPEPYIAAGDTISSSRYSGSRTPCLRSSLWTKRVISPPDANRPEL